MGNASKSRDSNYVPSPSCAIYGKQICQGIHFNEETSASVVFVHYTLIHALNYSPHGMNA